MGFSPELPAWFRFVKGEPGLDSEDDFSLPKQLCGLENRPQRRIVQEREKYVTIEPTEAVEVEINIISNILKTGFCSPEETVFALNSCSPNISKSLVDKILKRFSNDWIPAMGFFRWVNARSDFKHSPESYDAMIDILGKSKQFDRMWSLVEEMSRLGGLVSLSTMTKVMRRLAGAARWDDAVRAFHCMERFEVSKDTAAMNILLDSLCKEGSVERAKDAFLELRSSIPPNASSFNIMVHGWCRAKKLGEARKTLEEMEDFGFRPCAITYTSLIEAYCSDRDLQKAGAVLDEMRARGLRPNVVTYTIIMHSYGKANETQAALSVLDIMKSDGCLPDASVYNSLIYMFARAGRLREAYKTYVKMHKRQIDPNTMTFNTLISIACRHSRWAHALKFLVKMEETSCRPDIKTYTPLLKLSCARKWMRVLMFLLGHMFKRDISLDIDIYMLLVHRLCRAGKLKNACILYEEMVLKGLVPARHSGDMLLKELERKSMGAAKERVQSLMLKAHVY